MCILSYIGRILPSIYYQTVLPYLLKLANNMKLQVFYNALIINPSPYARKNEDQYILISRKNVHIKNTFGQLNEIKKHQTFKNYIIILPFST